MPAGDVPPRCGVGMTGHLLLARLDSGPGSAAGDIQLQLYPCRWAGSSVQGSVLAGYGVCPLFSGVAPLTSAGMRFLPSLKKLMCQIAWGRLKC